MLKMSRPMRMSSLGGAAKQRSIRAYHGWRGTTCPSQASQISCDSLTLTSHPAATSVDVERVFSRGRNLLPYNRNRLSTQSIRALLCLGEWSRAGFVKDKDILKVTAQAEVAGDEELPYEEGWDRMNDEEVV